MNHWIIVFPCLMYLASVCKCLNFGRLTTALVANVTDTATGIAFAHDAVSYEGTLYWSSSAANIIFSYLTISLSLNILLTLMIVTRLVLHSRDIRNAMGASVETNRLYKSIITILVESCALYAGSSLVYIVTGGLKGTNGSISQIFKPILAQTQVCAALACNLRAV